MQAIALESRRQDDKLACASIQDRESAGKRLDDAVILVGLHHLPATAPGDRLEGEPLVLDGLSIH